MRGTHRSPPAVQGEPESGHKPRAELMVTVSPPATTGGECPPDLAGNSAIGGGSWLMIKHHRRSHQERPGETRALIFAVVVLMIKRIGTIQMGRPSLCPQHPNHGRQLPARFRDAPRSSDFPYRAASPDPCGISPASQIALRSAKQRWDCRKSWIWHDGIHRRIAGTVRCQRWRLPAR